MVKSRLAAGLEHAEMVAAIGGAMQFLCTTLCSGLVQASGTTSKVQTV